MTQPERTSSPAATSRGALSPVRAAVLREDVPSTTLPSMGTRSPGRTTMTLPTSTSSGSTVFSPSAVSRQAESGRISIRSEMLLRLLPTATLWKSSPVW